MNADYYERKAQASRRVSTSAPALAYERLAHMMRANWWLS